MTDKSRHLRGPKDHLGELLFKPGFKNCKLYRRQTAFFQPSVFKCWASSIEEIVDECKEAVNWLFLNSKMLGFDKNKIILAGSSAGAHLAASTELASNTGKAAPSFALC